MSFFNLNLFKLKGEDNCIIIKNNTCQQNIYLFTNIIQNNAISK